MSLFGNRYRAEVLLALAQADDRGVCMGDLAASYGISASLYQAPIRALVRAELAVRLPQDPGERRKHYRRSDDNELWQYLEGLLRRLAAVTGTEQVG
ncbi:hypothetical protein ACIBCB_30070 [Streptomyces uncialis]|uniref:hypothetical protein n=1 Tax=Streptomyces TaxID=1883 RepID=UPI00225788E5|nr:hypothetical protein [Streptomyces uncialis]MCX4662927.1 hypothetical protein [Streptomyces uncialis]